MTDDYSKWDMKIAEWRGYTLKALEDMNDEIRYLKKSCKDMDDKLERIEEKLNKQSIGVGVTAGVVGIFAGMIVSLIVNVIV